MRKKKALAIGMCAAMMSVAVAGGTMAYLTDVDAQTNTFTSGDVKIDLWENFGDNDAEGIEKLLPAVGSNHDGTLKNGVDKEVYVTNTGSEDAYVRVHIAVPQVLDNAQPDFDASKNVLHFNYAHDSYGPGLWDWSKTTGSEYTGDWNSYEVTLKEDTNGDGVAEEDVKYNVYVVTYESRLAANTTTVDAIHQVYLDSKTTNEDISKINEALGKEWHVHVLAEAAQAEGFENAYDALNTAFGVPGEYEVDWATALGNPEGAKFAAPVADAEGLVDALAEGGVIILEESVALETVAIPAESEAVVNLGGNTVTTNGGFVNSGQAIVENGILEDTASGAYGARTELGGSTTFNNVDVVSVGGGVNAWGATVWNGGDVTVNSTTTNPRHVFYVAAADGVADGSLVINGGTFTFNPDNPTRKGSYICADGGTVIVNGGVFNKPSTRTAPIQALNGGSVTIYGGTFAFDPSEFVAEGYEAVYADGWWTVSAK